MKKSLLISAFLLHAVTAAAATPIWSGHAECGSGAQTIDVWINEDASGGTFFAPNSDPAKVLRAQGTLNKRDSSDGVQSYSHLVDESGPISRSVALSVDLNVDSSGKLVRAWVGHAGGTEVPYEPCRPKH
jgi:hypothetical protein